MLLATAVIFLLRQVKMSAGKTSAQSCQQEQQVQSRRKNTVGPDLQAVSINMYSYLNVVMEQCNNYIIFRE